MKEGESDFPRKEAPDRLPNSKWSTLNRAGCVYKYVYAAIHKYVCV